MRKIFITALFILGALTLYAGDIASFVDIGFSNDSRYFMFGQYGISSDSTIYCEIYTVNVTKNEFVRGGTYKKSYPLSSTSADDGVGALYKGLLDLAPYIAKNGINTLKKGRCLYVNISGEAVTELDFRDFKTGKNYQIKLVQNILGKAADNSIESTSAVRILTEKEGTPTKTYALGSSVKRKGVSGYSIKTVYVTPNEKGMVIVIEKTVIENNSVSVRYMVETLLL